ncbi:MAG: hypothetical protein ACP5HT_07575 [Conexivisphaera sp.]
MDVIGTGIRHLTTSNVLDLLIAFVFYVVTARILEEAEEGAKELSRKVSGITDEEIAGIIREDREKR